MQINVYVDIANLSLYYKIRYYSKSRINNNLHWKWFKDWTLGLNCNIKLMESISFKGKHQDYKSMIDAFKVGRLTTIIF